MPRPCYDSYQCQRLWCDLSYSQPSGRSFIRKSVISFDVSTLRTSGRDWIDLWITPYNENLALPIDFEVDLNGAPKNSLHIRMDFSGAGKFTGEIYKNFIPSALPFATEISYDQVLTPTARERSTFELQLSRTHIKFGMPKYNLWWIDSDITDLGWSSGILQLGHHSYTPEKDCGDPANGCFANTWHWDNVSINRDLFTMIKADRRYIQNGDVTQTVKFEVPAPSNAYLRFSGIGTIDVSLNGGPYQKAGQGPIVAVHWYWRLSSRTFLQDWMPVPKGTQTVTLRFSADGWYTPNFGDDRQRLCLLEPRW